MIDQGGRLALETICVTHHLIHLRPVYGGLPHVDTGDDYDVTATLSLFTSQHLLCVGTLNTKQEPSIPHFPGRLSPP